MPPKPNTIAVVTVNWNGWQMTLECLAALRDSRDADWHLIIVDNASSDSSAERLSGLGDDVTLIKSPENGGWAGGNNIGVEWALAAGFDWVFLLNNDALVEFSTLARLMNVAEDQPHTVLGPVHLNGDGTVFDFVGTDTNVRTGLPSWKSVDPDTVTLLPDFIETSTIKGAGMFVRAQHFKDVGLFEERFYLNFDETDWCYRARQAGLVLLMVKSARILHLGSGSIGGGTSPLQSYFLARNSLLFAERHCKLGQRWRLLRELYWDARNLPRYNSMRKGWFWRFLFQPTPSQVGFKLGLRDYVMRRFGECPPVIRALNRQV